MQGPKKIADTGKEAGKKVLATDTAQGVVGAVVDKLEEIAVDKADDVAATVKQKAAKAGGRLPERPSTAQEVRREEVQSRRRSRRRRSRRRRSRRRRSRRRRSRPPRSRRRRSRRRRSRPRRSRRRRSRRRRGAESGPGGVSPQRGAARTSQHTDRPPYETQRLVALDDRVKTVVIDDINRTRRTPLSPATFRPDPGGGHRAVGDVLRIRDDVGARPSSGSQDR